MKNVVINSLHYLLARQLHTLLLLSTMLISSYLSAQEATSNQIITPHVRASLISERNSVEAGQAFWVALHFSILEDWHTYWRNAGDSGNAPTISWQLPEGVTASDIHWPYPQRLPIGPLMNYGYSDEAWLLVRITVADTFTLSPVINLKADAEWLVCKVECIPEEGQFSLELPVVAKGTSQPGPYANKFATLQQDLPQPLPWSATVTVAENTLELNIALNQAEQTHIAEIYFFPQQYGIVEHAAAQPYQINNQGIQLTLQRGDLRSQSLPVLQGVLLLTETLPDGVLTRSFIVDAPATTNSTTMNLITSFAFALLGGVLLNIMPCVFPILSLKALAIVNSAAQSSAIVRRNGYAFTLGVLVSFALIALVLLLLRAGGEAIGWGFQLQSPVFVLLLSWLIFVLGLMLSGVWTFGASWLGAGQQLTQRDGISGSFFTGVLAVVVATPCTAPFMGTALGYALSQPTPIAMLIFLTLGFGMALPWLLISLWPGLSQYLPKPGAWMERTKQLLAFPLYATVAWLLWVLAQQIDQQQFLIALISIVLIALVLWLWQVTRQANRIWRSVSVISLLLLVAGLSTLLWQITPAQKSVQSVSDGTWQPYDPVKLEAYRRAGRPVFVNFTAAWCITCLVNEKIALSSSSVQTQLRQRNVVYMKGDWTNKDPVITQVLGKYNRSGVPLYLLFPANTQRATIVLPNILTESLVLDSLQQLDNE